MKHFSTTKLIKLLFFRDLRLSLGLPLRLQEVHCLDAIESGFLVKVNLVKRVRRRHI